MPPSPNENKTNPEPASPGLGRRIKSVASAAALRLAGPLVGGGFLSALEESKRVQWLTPDELRARGETRLAALLRHAAENVPFYRDHYRRQGWAPDELRTTENLQALPVMTKSDYRRHPRSHFLAENVPPHRGLERSTSGSTGEPFRFTLDRQATPLIFASHLFYDSWFGLGPLDRYIRIVSPPAPSSPPHPGAPWPVRLRRTIREQLQSQYERWIKEKVSVWEVGRSRGEHVWRRIAAFRPDYLMGYTSALATVADDLLKADLRLSIPLRAVVSIAETLSPDRRRVIEEYFRAPIIDRYGLRELGAWSGQACSLSGEQFHVNTELVVCEIVREDGSPAQPGETGRVVMTDLFNYVMPLIRYDTGDLAVAGSAGCACGRGFPLFGPIQGRSQECLSTPSGKLISPVILGQYLFVHKDNLDAVSHYQLVRQDRTRACFTVVPAPGWSRQRREQLQRDLNELLGSEMDVTIETVSEIPREPSGKRPIIKVNQLTT